MRTKKALLINIVLLICCFLYSNSSAESYLYNAREIKKIAFSDEVIIADAFIENNNLFVLESKNGALLVYELKNYRKIREIALKDASDSIGITKYSGRYYVPIPLKNKIIIYDDKFRKLNEINVLSPTDVECFRDSCYIVSNKGSKIIETDISLKRIKKEQGKFGLDKNEFRYHFDMVINNKGDIFISEVINTRIQVLSPNLKFVDIIGQWGVDLGQFYRPKGIALYQNRYLFVADGFLGVIQIFDAEKRSFLSVLSINKKVIKLSSPVRIKIIDNKLLVTDYYENKVYIYSLV